MDALLAWPVSTLAAISVAVAVCVCGYHLALMAVAVLSQPRGRNRISVPRRSFAIVIPAHNEEATILGALDCCAALDYPATNRTVYVIADNCSDGTAELATSRGATCLVRNDEVNRGKGFALAWALPKILAEGHDAVVILDADCRLEPGSLVAFDDELQRGERVLQASYVVANPEENAISYALAVANSLENDWFYAPKSSLGLSVFLRGTGMVFSREILEEFPWSASSIVEDAEYSCRLIEAGQRVRFLRHVRVLSDFPVQHDQLAVQRRRWIGGGLRIAVTRAPRLLRRGLMSGRPALFDAALTMFVGSRPMVVAQFVSAALLALVCQLLWPGQLANTLITECILVAAGYAIYVGIGVARLGITPKRVGLLARLPLIAASYLLMSVQALVRCNPSRWERTPRTTQVANVETVSANS